MSAKVFDELTCPECGGRIGGDGSAGVPACTCFGDKPSVSTRKPPPPRNLQSDSGPKGPVKLCRVCGKDLTGKPRLKDDGGYLCKACADVEDQKEADLIKCPECLRRLKSGAFVEYRGTLICKRCHQHHVEHDALKVAKVELTHHSEHDKQSLMKWLIILAVLLVLILISLARNFL